MITRRCPGLLRYPSKETTVLAMPDTTKEADRTISATEARSGLSDLIPRARYSEERTIFTRHGEPVAALISMEDLETLKKLEDATDVKRDWESIEDAREHGGTKSLGEFQEELEAKQDAL